MKHNFRNYLNIPSLITILIFCFIHKYFDFSFDEIEFTLYLAFGVYFSYLFICYAFVSIRMEIRESRYRKKVAIRKEEDRIKEEKYKETYDDY